MRARSNPPSTAEGEWVIKRWAPWLDQTHKYRAKPAELRWYARVDGKEVEREDGQLFVCKRENVRPKSRTFLPAFVQDNPYLMATDYVTTLQGLPEPMRSQLLYGDFSVGREDDAWQVIPTAWVKAAMNRWTPEGKRERLSAVGVDIAHGGPAKTVLAKRYGTWFAPLEKHDGKMTDTGMKAAALIQQAIKEWPQALVCIDAVGVGASAYDCCQELKLYQGSAKTVLAWLFLPLLIFFPTWSGHRQSDDSSEVHIGRPATAGWAIDIERLRGTFDRVDSCGWLAVPPGANEAPYGWVAGRFLDREVFVRLPADGHGDVVAGGKPEVWSRSRK